MNVGKVGEILVDVSEGHVWVDIDELTPEQARNLVVLLLDAIQIAEGADPETVGKYTVIAADARAAAAADPDKPRRAPMCGLPG